MRAKKNIIMSYVFIVINIFINLFVVRMGIAEYGDGIYAFIVLAFSFITYVESFNFGIYLSNRTEIPLRSSHASVYTISSVSLLSKLSFALLILWSIFYYFFQDQFVALISKETDPKVLEIGKELLNIAVLYGGFKIPLSVVLSSFAGNDLVDVEKKYNIVQQTIKFITLGVAVIFNLSAVVYLASFAIFNILLLIFANIHYYIRFIHHKKERFLKFSKKISSAFILKKSFKFYVFSVASVVVWSTDNLFVSMFFSPKILTDYFVNFSIYNAAFLFITAVANALIANYGNLIRDKNFEVLNFRINLSIYMTLVISMMIFVGGVLFAEDLIGVWVGHGHFVSQKLIIAFGFFGTTISFSSVLNTLLSLFARSKVIIAMTMSEAILNLVLSYIFLNIFGVEGIAYATGISAIMAIIIPGFFVVKTHFKSQLDFDYSAYLGLLIICCTMLLFTTFFKINFIQSVMLFFGFMITLLGITYAFKREYLLSLVKVIKG